MNDDMRVEESLRRAWDPQPPDGMRERVLLGARGEARRARPFWQTRWKPALAAVVVLLVVMADLSDSARDARVTAMVDGTASVSQNRAVASMPGSARWNQQMERFLAMASSDNANEEDPL